MNLNNVSPAYTIKVLSPDGTVYVHCTEDSKGKLQNVIINVGKAGSPLHAWADALGRMITSSLSNNLPLTHILEQLSNITSIKAVRTPKGIFVKSGPDAIYYALTLYSQIKPVVLVQHNRKLGFARIR